MTAEKNIQELPLHFDISSGLKTVLGSELITDDEVAIFELVKNSFDASASQVHIYFGEDKIVVADNGSGMSFDDLKEKWLFVAYSSKKDVDKGVTDFRDDIAEHRNFAGSKGIGRFSADRLGSSLNLQSRARNSTARTVHSLFVDWKLFDLDPQKRFEEIGVTYASGSNRFDVPDSFPSIDYGTVITITETKRLWDRESILRLKSALAKLINPFGAEADGFVIRIHAPVEKEADDAALTEASRTGEMLPANAIVNGDVGNFIFDTLREKTTFIEVVIRSDTNQIESTLTDRGELIYRIREPNPYVHLQGVGFQCQIFFLNQSAKLTFARRMGVPSIQFGAVFLFRNGFRVFPVGEPGDDWFRIDARKQQGYARFLGTRDVIGRIDVTGSDKNFAEASSRNAGLIDTAAVRELRQCFTEHCLKRLERYVVPVTFVDKEDKNTSDLSRLLTDPGKARVTNVIAKLVDNEEVELLDYSKMLVDIIDERSSQFEESLIGLRAIAEKTKDSGLFLNVEKAEKKFEELRRLEEEARRQADQERAAKEVALERAKAAEHLSVKVQAELDEEKSRNLFLSSLSTLEQDNIIALHHQVTIYAVSIQQQIENFLVKLTGKQNVPVQDVLNVLDRISLNNKKIQGVAKFATKANFRLESEKIRANLGEYIEQYINDVAKAFSSGLPQISVENDGKGSLQSFKPIDVAVVVDNLITNARKAVASKILFKITHPAKGTVHIEVTDNGRGLDKKISEVGRIFEKGFSTTDGSGLGLYHIQMVLGEMKGTIEAIPNVAPLKGVKFLIRIAQ